MLAITELITGTTTFLLVLASYSDLKTGEIPEKITRGLIAVNVIIAAICSIYLVNPSFLFTSLLVGAAFFVIGYLMFYLGEWGGGDVKLLAGIGCSLGLLASMNYFTGIPYVLYREGIFPYYIDYFVNLAIASSPYVIVYSLILGLMKPGVFRAFTIQFKKKTSIAILFSSFLPSLLTLNYDIPRLALIYLSIPLLVLISLYIKAVEEVALQKEIAVNELREGDILASDLVVEGKKIAGRRNMEGVNGKQVIEIQKLASEGKILGKITVRWGIKFAPILFIAFLLTLLFGDVLEILVVSLLT